MDTPAPSVPAEPPPAQPAGLNAPLPDLAAWTRHFQETEIPVLAASAEALELLRAQEDDIDAATLAALIESDPLLTIKFLAHVARKRRADDATEPETVLSSLVMTGISPFFSQFGPQPTVEQRLGAQPRALDALHELLYRARRAANFALAFAVHRGDTDAGVIQQAAFLHDFAEMLMLCHAPALELRMRDAQAADPQLRSAQVQRDTLNIELNDLRQQLFRLWHLPSLLVRISDDRHPDHANVRNVVLSVQLARHSMHGWDNPALPDDIEGLAGLLNAQPRIALAFAKKVDLHPSP